ncbi:L,D-transpeptidase family protein [Paenibacillus sp. N3.4]|uniref:L,D-transpeptidase family protein n=1 Tax=Paenibacillus sp. N3.4 TaxID=2603222 RepID=UPI0016502CE4|nr:L,D-transpeptidase family protein [Paenibacillus sp. N3.4]
MIRRGQRFQTMLDENLIHLHKNFFISSGDPQYYEKVLRYLDANSPEAHYKMGQKYQMNGNRKRAMFHYKEVLKTYPSPFYSAANRAIHLLDQQHAAHAAGLETVFPKAKKQLLPPFMKILLLVLFIVNLVLVMLFFGDTPIYKTISQLKVWNVGSDIVYETVDTPYTMYFAPDAKNEAMETALHKQAIALAQQTPKANIIIYGIVSPDKGEQGKTLLLTNEELMKSAVVIAQYHPASDRTVKIRFLNSEFIKHQPLSAIGANLVRTALQTYQNDHGRSPNALEALLEDYPHNYLSFIPIEVNSGSNGTSAVFNGEGGWVYDAGAGSLDAMFYANVKGLERVPFDPLHIEINEDEHHMKLISGTYLLWDKAIGLGVNGSTPQGSFQIIDRVQQPKGKTSTSYGEAGLSLGRIALHGTMDESSIGRDQSMGCIRLTNGDIQQIFPFVPKGTNVQIDAAKWPTALEKQVENTGLLIPSTLPKINQKAEGIIFHWLG